MANSFFATAGLLVPKGSAQTPTAGVAGLFGSAGLSPLVVTAEVGPTTLRLQDVSADPNDPRPAAVVGLGPWLPTPNWHAVFLKQYWADEWTAAPYFWADEMTWSSGPNISSARLWWDYGYLQRQGEQALSLVAKMRLYNRYYVKIAQTVDWSGSTQNWYGVLEIDEDQQGGTMPHVNGNPADVIATGEQTFTAYGLESMLDFSPIQRSLYTRGGGDTFTSGRALTFNRDGRPNRSFLQTFGGSHIFATDPNDDAFWSTREIVNYLLTHVTPVDSDDIKNVDWVLVDPTPILPTWDAPEVSQRGQTVWRMLTSLIARQRLVGYRITVNEREAAIDQVQLEPYSFLREELTTKGGNMPANPNQIALILDFDRTAAVTLKKTTLKHFDKVVARGRRRRSVFSVGFQDETLEAGWTAAHEAAYEAGFSGDAGYAALGKAEKQERNAEVRNNDELRDVFRRFVLPDAWDGRAGNGEGVVTTSPVFVEGTNWGPGFDVVPFYDYDLAICQSIPLLEGVDYSGSKVADDLVNTATGSDQNRPPFCAWKLPASGRWQSIDTLGQLSEIERVDDEDNRNWSGSVRIPQDSRAIELTVQGRPQHVLAFTDFTPLASIDEEEGEHEWQDCIITICVEDDRHAEGSFGESALPDAHRVLLIDAGQRYKHDFIAEQTVVGIADDGTLQRANAGYLTDDTDELEDIAKLAHGWYGTPRYALQFETHYMTSGLARGALIADLGIEWGDPNHYHPDINTVVTEIRITNNRTEEGEPDLPRMRVTTGAGELDPMQLLGRLAQPELKSWGELTGFHEGRAPEGNQ